MKLTSIRALTDNYIWMVDEGGQAIVVDPGEATPVLEALSERDLNLAAILLTHHHSDHTGGVNSLVGATQAAVYGPAEEIAAIPHIPLADDNTFTLLGRTLRVIDVPGHTAGHIAYCVEGSQGEEPIVFSGDTLFSGGCGRLFEGTPKQMLASLQRLAALPDNTRVCCAHEYTLSNLRFAQCVEPNNPQLIAYTQWCEAQVAQGLPTLPSCIAREKDINPFLRTLMPEIQNAVQAHWPELVLETEVAVFAALREWKNNFR